MDYRGGGGQSVCWPPSQIIGGCLLPPPPPPPPLPTPMQCFIPRVTDLLVLEKKNFKILTIYRRGGHFRDVTRPRGYKTFVVLNSVEHEILNAHKYKNFRKFGLLRLS